MTGGDQTTSGVSSPARYRCRACGDVPEPESHHKMTACKCGKVQVDRGWYGSRVLWDGGSFEGAVEVIASE